MNKTTITKREMYEVIMAVADGADFEVEVGEETVTAAEVVAFCQKEIEALDKKAAKARERAAEKRAESDELMALVEAALGEDYETIADITARVEFEGVTVAKVQNRLSRLYKEGKAEKGELTISTEAGKLKRTAYRLPTVGA